MTQLSGHGFRERERGFTLPEVLIVIAIMGILAAIAIPMWWSVIESRNVDSAANQLASDFRLAHTRATNQLTEWQVVYSHGSDTYSLTRSGFSANRSFEDAKVLNSEVGGSGGTIKFKPNGSAEVVGFADADGEFHITVSTTDGNLPQTISINMSTSRIKLD